MSPSCSRLSPSKGFKGANCLLGPWTGSNPVIISIQYYSSGFIKLVVPAILYSLCYYIALCGNYFIRKQTVPCITESWFQKKFRILEKSVHLFSDYMYPPRDCTTYFSLISETWSSWFGVTRSSGSGLLIKWRLTFSTIPVTCFLLSFILV